jgi:hypothetical protein
VLTTMVPGPRHTSMARSRDLAHDEEGGDGGAVAHRRRKGRFGGSGSSSGARRSFGACQEGRGDSEKRSSMVSGGKTGERLTRRLTGE